ncbi:MAG TPA: DUF1800 domain-containing protein [Steroidobacteraceae bacterium]
MNDSVTAAIAANRFGLGARPGELDAAAADPRGWLGAQLRAAAPLIEDVALQPSDAIVRIALALRAQRRERKQQSAPESTAAAGDAAAQAFAKLPQLYRPIYVSEVSARVRSAVASERSFVERLVQFWTNHFAVSVDKIAVLGLAGSLEREAIRPNVLRGFSDLLLAVEQHPAMLVYLDNHVSIGPHSAAAARAAHARIERKLGINENLAREILELHTLGVNGGYTQSDVTTFAQVITGWSIGGNGRLASGEPGRFVFRPEFHEPGAKTVLGKRYAEDGLQEGQRVLRDLATRAASARFIATKLARHFIADKPPLAAVDRLARVFLDTRGDLPSVYRALIELPQSWEQPLAKFKTPQDYVYSSFRALELPLDSGPRALVAFELLGQRTYSPGSPAGWPDRSADWDGSSAVLHRIEWADAVGQRVGDQRSAAQLAPRLLGGTLSAATRTSIARAASSAQALTLLLAAPEFMRR